MPQITHRANLSAAVFPMTVAKAGRSIIIPQSDNNYDKRVDPQGTQKDAGIPQAIYMENVLPTPNGYQTIGYKPDTSITIPVSQSINALQAVRFATTITSTSITADIDVTDDGDTLEVWINSAFFSLLFTGATLGEAGTDNPVAGVTLYTEVVESTAEGSPAINSYRLSHADNYSGSFPAQLYRNFGITASGIVSFDCRVRFKTGTSTGAPTFQKIMDIAVQCTATGAGIRIVYDSLTDFIKIRTSTGGWSSSNQTTQFEVAAITALAYDTWYTVEIDITRNIDLTRTVTATIKTLAAVTKATITGIIASSIPIGGYCGMVHEGANQAWGADTDSISPNKVYYDAIHVTGDVADATFTVNSGVASIYIAYFSNDTAKWSYDLRTWDNNATTLPGGFTSPSSDAKVSTAMVRGTGYVCIRETSTTKIYELSLIATTITFTDISATIAVGLANGYTINDILSISGSYNYLLLFTASTVFWSSTTTPTDFAFSLVSGAGFEVPGNLKGDITFVKEHLAGVFIYSTKNVVFMQYTGNARYPWKWREIGGSGGFNFSTQVSGDTNSSVQYGVNNAKYIQVLAPDTADIIAAEVTDFLERVTRWDILNPTTYVFSLSTAGLELIPTTKPTIWFVLDRYILMPFGMTVTNNQWSYIIIYDILLKRYGKLKITFDFLQSDETTIYFIDRLTGTIRELYFNIGEQSPANGSTYKHEGILVLGKFQYIRTAFITLNLLDFECAQDNSDVSAANRQFNVRLLPTYDGKTFITPITPTLDEETSNIQLLSSYKCRVSCHNFAVLVQGAFDLNTVEMTFQPDGDR